MEVLLEASTRLRVESHRPCVQLQKFVLPLAPPGASQGHGSRLPQLPPISATWH